MKNIALTILLLSATLYLAKAQTMEYTGKQAYDIRMKSTCGTLDVGKTRYGMWEGRVYSRIPGEKDRHLFNVIGVNTRHCSTKKDPIQGDGFRSVSREIQIYLDPKTNEIVDTWTNPWNGHEVEVVHVANDPVNMRSYVYEKDKEGKPARTMTMRKYGEIMASSHEIPLFYNNPIGGEYQAYVGGAYHAMEIFNTYYPANEIEDSNIRSLSQSNISWSRIAQWLPWMEMGDKVGIMVFNATGFSTFDEAKVWDSIKEVVKDRYPTYLTAPPLDDPRPNETSWTVFKKHLEGKEKAKVGAGGH